MSDTLPSYDLGVLRQELERDEGVRPSMYKDTRGFWTVGVGHNLSIPQSTFTINALFQNDVNGCEASLDLHWPWWRKLDGVRQRVMLGLMFNLGSSGLASFVHFLAAMEVGDWATASAQLGESLYARQVGQRAVRYQYMIVNGATEPGTV